MKLKEYPTFAPPETLATKSPRQWTKKEASAYFDWLTACQEPRVRFLLEWLQVGDSEGLDSRSLLVLVGERLAAALREPTCTTIDPEGAVALTNIGYSLAADAGLLVAREICQALGDRVSWSILRKPKNDASYNLPILTGLGPVTYDPIGVSIADAASLIAGRRTSRAWVDVFDECVAYVLRANE